MRRPYFFWDYPLEETEIKKILRSSDETAKKWLVARILEHAHFQDVFKYLDLKEILAFFPKLKLRPINRQYWQRAFSVWGYHV